MDAIAKKFERAYDEHAPSVLRHIYFRVSDWNIAEDLAQETFFKAWRSIAQGDAREIKSFKAFFYKIANNIIIDHYRSKKKDISLESLEEPENLAFEEASQERAAELKIDKENLERHLKSLKDEYREMLVMRYIDDMSIEEISEVTGKTNGNVRVLIHRSLQALKKKYER